MAPIPSSRHFLRLIEASDPLSTFVVWFEGESNITCNTVGTPPYARGRAKRIITLSARQRDLRPPQSHRGATYRFGNDLVAIRCHERSTASRRRRKRKGGRTLPQGDHVTPIIALQAQSCFSRLVLGCTASNTSSSLVSFSPRCV